MCGFKKTSTPPPAGPARALLLPKQPSSLAKAEMFHADYYVDPGFVAAAVAIGKPGAPTHKERLCAEIGRGRGLSCSSQKAGSQPGLPRQTTVQSIEPG